MKTFFMNLDSLFFRNNDTALKYIYEKINASVEDHTSFLGCIVMEIIPPNQVNELIAALKSIKNFLEKKGINSFRLILMNSYKEYEKDLGIFDVNYFESLGNLTANGYLKSPEKLNLSWNYRSNKFLVLTGIPHRYNRVRLLYNLYREDLLTVEKSVWSFFEPFGSHSLQSCRDHLHDVSDADFKDFMKIAVKKVDDVLVIGGKFAGQTRYNDFTVDKINYNETCLSIITETFFQKNHPKFDVSEKTWRTILNRHPFLLFGPVNICKHLESLGFKTFREYFPIDYDVIENDKERSEAITYNLKEFLKNKHTFLNHVLDDIDHNYTHFQKMICKERQIIEKLLTDLNIDQKDKDSLINTVHYWHFSESDFVQSLDSKQNS